jgi:hypothetical protein
MTKTRPEILIAHRFRHFNSEIKANWETYCVTHFYIPRLHLLLKRDLVEPLTLKSLTSESASRTLQKATTFGTLSRVNSKSIPRQVFIDSIISFEDFFTDLMYRVYSDIPTKLLSKDSIEVAAKELKLIDIIVKSDTKEEMIDAIIEEKTRAIFYGNPVDLFTKDKAKLDFGDYFTANRSDMIDEFRELIGRRNIIIHNRGVVDRKYLRENPKTTLVLGKTAPLTEPYNKRSLCVLRGLAACAAKLVIENVYKVAVKGEIGDVYRGLSKSKAT